MHLVVEFEGIDWRSVGRYFAKFPSGFMLGIGYFMVGWTKRKQGYHEKLVKTLVIKARSWT